jgi:N utilization substance protein A
VIVKEGDIGMAVGRQGNNIRLLEKMTNKKHEIIEYSENPQQFIKNALKPARIKEIRISERPDGKTIAVVAVNPKDKGVAIGKNGKNAERIRFLAKRYFQIQNVSIT